MKPSISAEQEKVAFALFEAALPYYWKTADKLPAGLRFRLAMNGYGSAQAACTDIALHWLVTPKLKRQAARALTHMQSWKGEENDTMA